MATIVAAAGGGDWNTGGSWVGGVAPTAADDAQVVLASGNMSIGSGAVCRSADFSTYTGTLSGTGTLTIGDATAGISNIALKLVAGMTVTGTPSFTFISTSATVQTIDFANKRVNNVTFSPASGGSWQLTGQMDVNGTGGTVTLTRGTLNTNGQTCAWGRFESGGSATRALTLGASVITMGGNNNSIWNTNNSGITFTANTSEIIFTGFSVTFRSTNLTYNKITFTGSGAEFFNNQSSAITIGTLTVTGSAAKTDSFQIGSNLTITVALVLTGNSTINRLQVRTDTVGTARTLTTTGATVTATNVDFMDITLSVSKDFSAQTDIGNGGGCTNITFPASVTQTWSGTSGGNWSTNAWTTRVPLPQDDVVISSAFSASQTITADMPRLGRSITWAGSTGNPTWAFSSITNALFGSFTLISGMVISGTQVLNFSGRSSFTITTATKSITPQPHIVAPSGTYTLSDSFSTTRDFFVDIGGFDTGNFDMTMLSFATNNSNTRSVTLGTSTITATSTGLVLIFNMTTATGMTFSGANSTFIISGAGSSARTFAGGGKIFGTLTYTVAGSTGQLEMTGSNSFAQINFSDITNARTLLFTAGTTTTIRNLNGFNVRGTSGKLMTIGSITAANHTLNSSLQQSTNYVSISRSVVDANPKWYAGYDSTDGSNNTNWIFSGPIKALNGLAMASVKTINGLTRGLVKSRNGLQ